MEQPRPRPSGPILVVDDDEGFRDLLVRVLAHFGYPTREAATGEEALEAARREPPRLAIVEVCLPGIAGYQVCRQLRAEFGNDMPIIFVSGEQTKSYDRVAGFLVGGDDFLVKPFALDEFVARVQRHLERTRAPGTLAAALTLREAEVLRLLADGFGRGEIASRLFISPKTAGSHLERIFKKLDVHNRAEAVSFAYRHGLIEGRHEEASAVRHG
jgi:DNA-binding response OmpR family regulator